MDCFAILPRRARESAFTHIKKPHSGSRMGEVARAGCEVWAGMGAGLVGCGGHGGLEGLGEVLEARDFGAEVRRLRARREGRNLRFE